MRWSPRAAFARLGYGNLAAGLAVGAFLIPQAMAYGQLAGVGVAIGLGVAAIPLLIYPLIGKHTWLSLGPESAVALMAAATAMPIAAQYGVSPLSVLSLLALGAGAILLAARVLKAAVVTDLLSKPVLTGYLTGIAVLMVLSQVGNALGSDVDTTTLVSLARTAGGATLNWDSALLCAACVAVILALRAVSRKIPGILVALVAGTAAGTFLHVERIGTLTYQFPEAALPQVAPGMLLTLAAGAGAIALVAYTDTIVTARAFADGKRVDANRELTALGVSQVAVGALGGYPVSASSSRTAIARDAGATSRFYSWVVAAVAIGAPLALAGFIEDIPIAVLAAIVIVAAASLVDVRAWKELYRTRWGEVAVAASCTAGVLLLGILPGILVAVALSVAELLTRLARPHDAVLGVVPGLAGMHDVDDHPDAQTIEGLVVFRYDAPLFFANANNFYNACLEAADTQGCRWFLLNVESNVEIDSSGLDALIELHEALARDGKRLALARVKGDMLAPMRRYGVLDRVGEENIFPTLPSAVAAYMAWKDSGSPEHQHRTSDISPVHRFARVARKDHDKR